MILHPGILSLITGTVVTAFMLAYAALLASRVLTKWDMSSSSAYQLSLERKTYLISVIMNFVMGFYALSLFLFIYIVDDIHTLFIGAMCATGSLNANPVGWSALLSKFLAFFLSLIWIGVNHIDQQAEDYPLVKIKFSMLLLMLPLVFMDLYYQVAYFSGLKPNVITSCCGALFGEYGGAGPANSIVAAPIKPMMMIFYSTVGAYVLCSMLSLVWRKSSLIYLAGILSLALLGVSVASIISFISLYMYEIPTHHCPFDIIQKDYGYVGVVMYVSLFGGVFFGMLSGLSELLKVKPSLVQIIERNRPRWVICSLLLIITFVVISSWPILFSDFTLEGYF